MIFEENNTELARTWVNYGIAEQILKAGALSPGNHSVRARYLGGETWFGASCAGSTSLPVDIEVTPAAQPTHPSVNTHVHGKVKDTVPTKVSAPPSAPVVPVTGLPIRSAKTHSARVRPHRPHAGVVIACGKRCKLGTWQAAKVTTWQ